MGKQHFYTSHIRQKLHFYPSIYPFDFYAKTIIVESMLYFWIIKFTQYLFF